VKAAGITEPDPASAVTSGAAVGAAPGRRPWRVWAVPFALLFALLCVRNRFLFTAQEDPALTAQPARTSAATRAKRVGLVVLATAVLFFLCCSRPSWP